MSMVLSKLLATTLVLLIGYVARWCPWLGFQQIAPTARIEPLSPIDLQRHPPNRSAPATANKPVDHKSRLRHVAIEAHGMAEEVHTFHELEEKTRGCEITGPCAWQFSFGPTDVSVIAPEPHVIYHYSMHTMHEHDTTSESLDEWLWGPE